jgi:hypothetical protein
VCKLYLLFITANAAQEKKEKKVLQATGVSKSVAHALILCQSCVCVYQFEINFENKPFSEPYQKLV